MKTGMMKSLLGRFYTDTSAETALPIAIFFSIAIAFTAILAVPFLDRTSKEYAESKAFGIDAITTSSVGEDSKPKTYIMRRSIFDKGLKKICKSSEAETC